MTDALVIKIARPLTRVNWAASQCTGSRGGTRPYNAAVATPVHAVEHYENFPVASWLVPARLRPPIVAIYRFARHADDIADEGDAPPAARLAALAALHAQLARAADGREPSDPVVAQLVPHVRAHRLDWSRFHALLGAFEQDVTVHRYPTRAALLEYCARSADPVGQLVLAVFEALDPVNRGLSDRICTALQLINFAQDVAIDWSRGRLYLPLADLARHGVGEADIAAAARNAVAGPGLRACIAEQARAAAQMLASGAPLARRVPGRLAWELRAIVAGAARVLRQLERGGHDPFARRPRLTPLDAPPLLMHVLRQAVAR